MSQIVIADNSSKDYVTGRDYEIKPENMSTNSSIEPYTELEMSTIHGVMVVLYTATTLLAICGNILAIIIFTKGQRSKTDLRPFLINLAVADLIMAIFCIPFTSTYQLLDSNWIFSRPMCPIVMFLQIVSVTGSVSTNIAIGIDRFCAVVFPLSASRNSRHRYVCIIVAIWFFAIATGSVQFYVGDTVYVAEFNHVECKENWPSPTLGLIYTILVLVLTYLVPVVVLTATYSIVGYLLWKRNLPGNADAQRDQTQLKAKLKILKMLVTIVVLFVLCWLPIHTFFLVLNFSSKLMDERAGPLVLTYYICHWIAMSNSFVNPIVYCSLNDSFRDDVKTLFLRLFTNQSDGVRQGAVRFKFRGGKYIVNDTSPKRMTACPTTALTESAYIHHSTYS